MATGEALRRGLGDEVQLWAAMKRVGVTLRYMTEFGSRCKQKNLLISAQFLHKQLPIRLARRVMELERLPFGLSQKHPVLKVPSSSFIYFFVLVSGEGERGNFSCNKLDSSKTDSFECRIFHRVVLFHFNSS